jgi:hypothetical protein
MLNNLLCPFQLWAFKPSLYEHFRRHVNFVSHTPLRLFSRKCFAQLMSQESMSPATPSFFFLSSCAQQVTLVSDSVHFSAAGANQRADTPPSQLLPVVVKNNTFASLGALVADDAPTQRFEEAASGACARACS